MVKNVKRGYRSETTEYRYLISTEARSNGGGSHYLSTVIWQVATCHSSWSVSVLLPPPNHNLALARSLDVIYPSLVAFCLNLAKNIAFSCSIYLFSFLSQLSFLSYIIFFSREQKPKGLGEKILSSSFFPSLRVSSVL